MRKRGHHDKILKMMRERDGALDAHGCGLPACGEEDVLVNSEW